MKDNDIFAIISRRYSSFTRMEQGIADYVLAHGREVLDMSISVLAQACNVVDSTVFRFCRSLGMKGYRDFRMALAISLSRQLSVESAGSADPLDVQVRRIYEGCVTSLQETCRLLRLEKLEDAVRHLIVADRVLVLGTGKSMVTAFNAYRQLLSAIPGLQCVLDAQEQRRLCASLGPGDVVILFAHGDMPEYLTELVRHIRSRGCYLLLISPLSNLSLSVLADNTLLCGGFGGSGSVVSTQAFLIELLYRLYLDRLDNARRAMM